MQHRKKVGLEGSTRNGNQLRGNNDVHNKGHRYFLKISLPYSIKVCRFFWIIMSCTESMVAFSRVVSVALVRWM
jgi:hypothetical protein